MKERVSGEGGGEEWETLREWGKDDAKSWAHCCTRGVVFVSWETNWIKLIPGPRQGFIYCVFYIIFIGRSCSTVWSQSFPHAIVEKHALHTITVPIRDLSIQLNKTLQYNAFFFIGRQKGVVDMKST